MQKEKLIRLDIVLKPSVEAGEKVIGLSRELGERYENEFVLDGNNFFPHITVYAPVFPEKIIEKIIEALEKLAKKFKVFEMRYLKITPNQGWIGVEFECTDEIMSFHIAVVNEMNLFREGHNLPEFEEADKRAKLSSEKIDNIDKYGFPGSMALYHPHLTIIRLKDFDEADRVAKEIEWGISDFKSDTVAIYKMGEHGTCIELVKEFKLN